jgi:hypothetical protein
VFGVILRYRCQRYGQMLLLKSGVQQRPKLADCVAKLFLRPKRAILIQDEAQAHNIDSKNHSIKFDYCPGASHLGVLQHNRPDPDIPECPWFVRYEGQSGH